MSEGAIFAPLHVRSEYSAGVGTADVASLCERCAALAYPALALTDVENLYGLVELLHQAPSLGLRAIAGVELRAGFGAHRVGVRAGRLVLLARDAAGYRALCRIVTRRRAGPAGETLPSPLDGLPGEHAGLFWMSDDPAVLEALRGRGVSPDDLRFLLVRPGPATGPPPGIRVVADPDLVMPDDTGRPLQALLHAIRTRRRVDEIEAAEPPERSLPDRAALRSLYADAPAALAESLRIAEACELDLDALPPPLPEVSPRPDEALRARCAGDLASARAAERCIGTRYDERLAAELAVIADLGLSPYFLVVSEILELARQAEMPVGGRGSALGALTVHLLGLGHVDPVALDLRFERFLNPGRRALPDIDLDLPSDRRDALLAAVFRHFGRERAAMVCALDRFRLRSALREGLTALGLGRAALDRFLRALPPEAVAEDLGLPLPLSLLPAALQAKIPLVLRLVGRFRHIAVHPGGLVLAAPRVSDHAPLERAPKGVSVMQYDLRAAARLGLLKIDLLGNRALAALETARAALGAKIEPVPDDPETLATLHAGRTVGCFQVESPPVRSVLRRVPIRGLRDLMAALAVVRPGPASGEAKAAFIRRARGEEAPEPPIARLAPVFADTQGLPLYEEQLMEAIARCTGWSLTRADALRAEIRDLAEAGTEPLRVPFTEACLTHGLSAGEAAAAWRMLARFAGYSFNAAHAAGYAEQAYAAAWFKTHHPGAFACGVLAHYGGQYPLRTVAAEMARLVPLRPPDVTRSDLACRLEPDGGVRLGLGAVKRLPAAQALVIVRARPFRDLADLLARVRLAAPAREALIRVGACDGLSPLSPEVFPFTHDEVVERLRRAGGRPEALVGLVPRAPGGPKAALFQGLVRVKRELEVLDMHPSHHPLALLRPKAIAAGCVTSDELPAHSGRIVRFAALLAATRPIATRDRRAMQFATLEDEHGLIEAVVSPEVHARLGDPLDTPGPWLVTGRVAVDRGDVTLQVRDVHPFHDLPSA